MAKTSDPDLTLSGAEAAFLDDLFAEANAAPPGMPAGLQAKLAADAVAMMPSPVTAPPVAPAIVQQSWFAGVVAGLGGWQAMGGLTTALVLGFGIGLAPPDAMETLATDLLGGSAAEQIQDVFWGFDSDLLEG